jgi:hypothetical protein
MLLDYIVDDGGTTWNTYKMVMSRCIAGLLISTDCLNTVVERMLLFVVQF